MYQNFSPTFLVLRKFSMFDLNLYFWPKFRFLTKILIFSIFIPGHRYPFSQRMHLSRFSNIQHEYYLFLVKRSLEIIESIMWFENWTSSGVSRLFKSTGRQRWLRYGYHNFCIYLPKFFCQKSEYMGIVSERASLAQRGEKCIFFKLNFWFPSNYFWHLMNFQKYFVFRRLVKWWEFTYYIIGHVACKLLYNINNSGHV